MEVKDREGKILVVGRESGLKEMVSKAIGDSYEVIYTSEGKEGLEKARKEIPDAIILGYLEPRGASFDLHRRLRGGWITKNIPLLVVDVGKDEHSRKGWTQEEGMLMDADNYVSLSNGGGHLAVSQLVSPVKLLRDRVHASIRETANVFKEAILDTDTFCVTWEQVAGRGAFEMQQEEIIDNVEKAVKGSIVHGISVTDNPGGNPAISTDILCSEIKKLGIEPLVHLASRDKNRNQMESMLYGLAAAGIRNLLVLTGDAPSNGGFNGQSKPVFDLDPVHVLQLMEMMNNGMEHEVMRRKRTLAPTDIFPGVCISPFKGLESELIGQYNKLRKKIEAGAKFIITQVGYDVGKFHELIQWLKINGYNIPVLANIYVLSYGTAKVMNANQIPGCVVTDKLVAELAEEAKAEDKGRSARLLRAAKMYALAKGLGYAGAHIGGMNLSYEMVDYIVKMGEEMAPNWQDIVEEFYYPQKDGFYFFERAPESVLNLEKPAPRPLKPAKSPVYVLSKIAHTLLFNPKSLIFKVLQPVAKYIDTTPSLKSAFGYGEHLAKVAMFGCMNCGDCALFDMAYLCPMSQCPKSQRNGPCGGSCDGWCEVYPNERKCVWVKAYERAKASGDESKLGGYIVPPCNWELFETPSWLNFYLGRDHSAKRLGVKPPPEKPILPEPGLAKEVGKATI